MKRVLIVNSNSVNIGNATGITLQSVFERLNPDELMEIYWSKSGYLNGNVKLKSIALEYAPLSLAALIANPNGKKISKSVKSTSEQGAHSGGAARTVLKYLRQLAVLQADLSRVKLTKRDFDEIKAFNPEVIYTLGGGVASLKTAYLLSVKLDIPIVIHFMDNWRHCIQWEDNPLLGHYKRKLKKYCDLCYTRSTECIAISPEMAGVYTKETGIKHSVLMNSINVDEFYSEPRLKDGVLRFVYAGGLHLGREKGLYELAKAIHKAAENKGISAEFAIYTSSENIESYKDVFKEFSEVKLVKAVPHSEIKAVLASADFLVHTESNALVNNNFFKYSVSTKIPEYLSSGRPVLFYGPSDIYLYKFLKESETAVTADNEEMLLKAIKDMIDGKYDALSAKAVNYAEENFDVSATGNTFCNVINNAKIRI